MSAPAIEFTGVSRWYGDTVSLADVSFTADAGVVGLLGHNGAGKSTTLKLCAGFSTPSTGTVRIYGDNPRRNPDVYRRDRDRARPQPAVAVPDGARGGGAVRPPAQGGRLPGGRRPRDRDGRAGAAPPTGGWPGSRTACASG